MIKQLKKVFVTGKREARDSDLSLFVRKASSAQKKKIFKRVLLQATEDQRRVVYSGQ